MLKMDIGHSGPCNRLQTSTGLTTLNLQQRDRLKLLGFQTESCAQVPSKGQHLLNLI